MCPPRVRPLTASPSSFSGGSLTRGSSTGPGERGAADAERGFALKFYTGEGNWDLVGPTAWAYGKGVAERLGINIALQAAE